jgi:hypothetical protein
MDIVLVIKNIGKIMVGLAGIVHGNKNDQKCSFLSLKNKYFPDKY